MLRLSACEDQGGQLFARARERQRRSVGTFDQVSLKGDLLMLLSFLLDISNLLRYLLQSVLVI